MKRLIGVIISFCGSDLATTGDPSTTDKEQAKICNLQAVDWRSVVMNICHI